MTVYDLPNRWKTELQAYIDTKDSPYNNLGAEDFPSDKALKLKFPDNSTIVFNFAMVLDAPKLKEVAVFTEHCGFHIFPSYGLQIEEVNIPYSSPISSLIDYEPEELRNFNIYRYEWIDNLHFTMNPEEFIENPENYLKTVSDIFLEHGWYGDGEIQLMWVPPFTQKPPAKEEFGEFYQGTIVWHVKQLEDGLSWILSPIELAHA